MADNGFAEGVVTGMASNDRGYGYGYPMPYGAYNGGFGGFGFGSDWIGLIILFALFGWGGFGNGGWGGFGNNWGGQAGFDFGKLATTNDVNEAINNSNIQSSLGDIKLGQSNILSAIATGVGDLSHAICQDCCQTRQAITDVGFQVYSTACDTQKAIADLKYTVAQQACDIEHGMEMQTRDIVDAQRAGTDRILDFLTAEKIQTLQAQNLALANQLSQDYQTKTLLDTLQPVPKPAYITASPYQSIYGTYGYNYGYPYNYGFNGGYYGGFGF